MKSSLKTSTHQGPRPLRALLLPLLLSVSGAAGCVPGQLPFTPDMATVAPTIDPNALDPKSIFEASALPDFQASCQGCHALTQSIYPPFLARGSEYQSITSFGNGVFITQDPADSLLLTKGQHEGPALTAGQYTDINAWLSVEAATRTGLPMTSPATPSVAVGAGNFFISLEKLTGDPISSLTFTVALADNNTTWAISNITITTGAYTGLHIAHPIFVTISLAGAIPDKADSLSDVDVMVAPSSSVALGEVRLTQVPRYARLAMAFQTIAQVSPNPAKLPTCKDFALFNSTIVPTLAAPCALVCHGSAGTNPTYAATANAAFDMSAASGTSTTALQSLCVNALARTNLTTPLMSVIVLQPTPEAQGGTPNHPYKITAPAALTSFTNAITAWAAKEK